MNRIWILLIALPSAVAWAQPADYMERLQRDYRDLFASYDRNHDGVLMREEVSTNNRLASLFDSMDINRDGRVTRDELERWLADIPIYAR